MNYQKEYKKQIKTNVSKVVSQIDDKQMKIKIKNWAEKFGYSFNTIKNKILKDEAFRCIFAKDPAKQNIYENVASEYISSFDNVQEFKKLPSAGDDALYLSNGKLLKGSELKNQAKDTKSIDFSWITNQTTVYASHKYTKDEGGAQDNQYADIQEFLKNARDCSLKNVMFIAICDGEYYQRRDSKTGDNTKIERLKRLTDNKTSFVKTINNLYDFLKTIQKHHLKMVLFTIVFVGAINHNCDFVYFGVKLFCY